MNKSARVVYNILSRAARIYKCCLQHVSLGAQIYKCCVQHFITSGQIHKCCIYNVITSNTNLQMLTCCHVEHETWNVVDVWLCASYVSHLIWLQLKLKFVLFVKDLQIVAFNNLLIKEACNKIILWYKKYLHSYYKLVISWTKDWSQNSFPWYYVTRQSIFQ